MEGISTCRPWWRIWLCSAKTWYREDRGRGEEEGGERRRGSGEGGGGGRKVGGGAVERRKKRERGREEECSTQVRVT